jgi:hypothetical protein
MKDFHQFRKSISEVTQVGRGGSESHSDGKDDSGSERRKQDKDYSNLQDIYDGTSNPNGTEFMVYAHLVMGYNYKSKIAQKTMIRNNPDIARINIGAGGDVMSAIAYRDGDTAKFTGNLQGKQW